MIAKPGHKFVLTFTFPSGQKYAAGEMGGLLIFVPFGEDGRLRGVIAWNSVIEFERWWGAWQKRSSVDNWANLMKLQPDLGQVKVSQ